MPPYLENCYPPQLKLPEAPPAGDWFYVITSGLVAIVEDAIQDMFYLYLVRMDGEHHYRAGSWLNESPIPAGLKASLTGVRAGQAKLDPIENPLLKLSSLPRAGHPAIQSTFILPRPQKIFYTDQGNITIVNGAANLASPAQKLSGMTVLAYALDGSDYGNVRMAGGNYLWSPAAVTQFSSGARLAAIHIDNAPAGEVPLDHHVREFQVSAETLGSSLEIGSAVQVLPNQPQIPGLSHLELTSLDDREKLSDLFQDFVRTGAWNLSNAVTRACCACCGSACGIRS